MDLFQKSVSSLEDKVEQCKESHFSRQNQSEVANEEKIIGRKKTYKKHMKHKCIKLLKESIYKRNKKI